jgi:regulator of RNase E activity RraA
MNPPLDHEILEGLRRLDACTLANAIETFQVRLRNEGFGCGPTHCLFPRLRPMVGYAVTVKTRGASPPTGARTYLDRTEWWDYLQTVPEPRVVVIQDTSSKPGFGSLLGEVHISILQALGCIGAVTNGTVRDLPAVSDLAFHLFATGLAVSHAYVHIVEIGTPVEIDGLAISSGDLLHGDLHGFQSVPREIAARLPAVAAQLAAREHELVALCRAPGFSLEKLRAAVGSRRG